MCRQSRWCSTYGGKVVCFELFLVVAGYKGTEKAFKRDVKKAVSLTCCRLQMFHSHMNLTRSSHHTFSYHPYLPHPVITPSYHTSHHTSSDPLTRPPHCTSPHPLTTPHHTPLPHFDTPAHRTLSRSVSSSTHLTSSGWHMLKRRTQMIQIGSCN